MNKPATDKPNVLPANVAHILAELQRLAATGDGDYRTGERRRAKPTSALIIRGKEPARD